MWNAIRLRKPNDVVPGECISGWNWNWLGTEFYWYIKFDWSVRWRRKRCGKCTGKSMRRFGDKEGRSEWVSDFVREVKIIVSAARHFPQGKEEVCNDFTGNRFEFRLSNDAVLLVLLVPVWIPLNHAYTFCFFFSFFFFFPCTWTVKSCDFTV